MKSKLRFSITIAILLCIHAYSFAQAPPLGSVAGFVLFTTNGAVSNTGITHLTGNVGTNNGSSTGFGNVDGVMHDNDAASALCASDLLIAYNQLNSTVPTAFPAPLLGNGQVLTPGVFSISGAATMNADLTLDALGDPNAVFIFQIQGPLSAAAASKVFLVNGALACNVFWKVEGLVSLATGTTMRGTIIANNAAINLSTGDTLEGRALSTTGAITTNGLLAYMSIGCGSVVLTGPIAPSLAAADCYALFSSNGPVTNVGVTYVTGDIGTNNGSALGFNPLFVTGTIHPVPDGSTAACATDLNTAYNYLNLLPYDIELLYPAQFGNNLVLSPHTYLMNAAVTFTDTLFLDAQNNPDAVFIIKTNGAFSTSTYSKVVLINGAQAANVYWKMEGAVSINDYSIFCGTIISNNGALNLNTGTQLIGKALTTTGALSSSNIIVTAPFNSASSGTITGSDTVCQGQNGVIYSVPLIPNANGYNWTVPPGVTITSGNNTNSITVNFSMSAVSDTITASGTNACGNGSVTTIIFVTVIPTVSPAGNIIGPDTVCAGQTGVIYSVPVIPNTLGYNWILPPGAIISAGANTDSITVDFSAIAVSGTITVQGFSSCGNGIISSDFLVTVLSSPAIAGLITGTDTVCQGQTGVIYSVPVILNASGYIWTLPSGATITNGNNTDSITVDFSLISISGMITVQGANACDTGLISINFPVTVLGTPDTAGIISGPDTVCQGQTGIIYTVAPVANAVGYIWTLPAGASITNGGNTNTITVDFSSSATSGNFNVQAYNNCDTGIVSVNFTVTVLAIPDSAGIIVGPDTVCQGQTGLIYSVPAIQDATGYTWILPPGATITNGNNTDSIVVDFSLIAVSGNITVLGMNNCGTGIVSSNFFVTVMPLPGNAGIISGTDTVCQNSTGIIYTVTPIANATDYLWTLPVGATITAGLNTDTITVDFNSSSVSGTISVQGSNSCGNGAVATFTVIVNPSPVAVAGSNSPVCLDSSIYLNTPFVTGGTYNWSGPNNYTSALQNPVITSASTANSGSYSVTVTSNGCSSSPSVVNVTTEDCNTVALHIPEGYSPNGDLINDFFVIRGIENYPNNSIVIYNRWGDLVFEASPYQNTWDGKATKGIRIGGDEMPAGTYFYLLNLGDGSEVIKGTIYLSR